MPLQMHKNDMFMDSDTIEVSCTTIGSPVKFVSQGFKVRSGKILKKLEIKKYNKWVAHTLILCQDNLEWLVPDEWVL